MPDIAEIKATMRLDIGNWQKNTDQAKKDMQGIGKEVDRQKKALGDLQVAGTAAFAGLALAIGATVKQFAAFDQEMANLRSVTKITADQLSVVKNAAMELGPAYGRSAADVAKLGTEMVKAGVSLNTLVSGDLKSGLDLMIAGELDAADAAAYASTALNGYKNESLKLKDIADIASGAASASATSVREMAQANQALGPTAALVGAKFEDVNTALAVFAQNALRGSDSGGHTRPLR